MSMVIRPAVRADLPRLTEIYNHYVIHTPVTFDLEPYTVERRVAWFEQFAPTGRYRLLVAEEKGEPDHAASPLAQEREMVWSKRIGGGVERSDRKSGLIIGFAGTTKFRVKPAYDTTVETTIYCSQEALGKGVGRTLYGALFEALAGENINRIVAGYTLPNPASAKLHEQFGFKPVGIFSEVGFKFGKYWDVQWTERPLTQLAVSI
ncbi:MAG TPA: GNAT family N-acetyltransferase [Candidatus Angelobacter sp.]|nr:GNAT family N-acetyltransferase [Candidatus Angelobacter sp.]